MAKIAPRVNENAHTDNAKPDRNSIDQNILCSRNETRSDIHTPTRGDTSQRDLGMAAQTEGRGRGCPLTDNGALYRNKRRRHLCSEEGLGGVAPADLHVGVDAAHLFAVRQPPRLHNLSGEGRRGGGATPWDNCRNHQACSGSA